MIEYISKSISDTNAIAKELAQNAKPGDVIALVGEMGAGKTHFSKAFAKELGITSTVNSPTFTIMNSYEEGRIPLYHFDAYRIEDPDEMTEIGFEEFIYGQGVCVIEWADIIKDILPTSFLLVKIETLGENERKIKIEEVNGL